MPNGPIPNSEGRFAELKTDPRWQLVERVVRTEPFQRSAHLTPLLRYLAEQSIRGRHAALTERQIGRDVFGKPADYSTAEDSIVRVHVRQLRLRLHEYYAREGRNEKLVIDIPRGLYVPEFHQELDEERLADLERVPSASPSQYPLEPKSGSVPTPTPAPTRASGPANLWRWSVGILALAVLICAFGWRRDASLLSRALPPWPLSSVIREDQSTTVVASDSRTMLRLLGDKEMSLAEYLQPGFLDGLVPRRTSPEIGRLMSYISGSELTSNADLYDTVTVMRLAGRRAGQVAVRSARDLSDRDLQRGSYIFLGGPTSNPWVQMFESKLNFQVVEDGVGGGMYFRNRNPHPGEQAMYEGLKETGSAGDDYATISVFPTSSGNGNIMLLQGLREEGTEALGQLLADPLDRLKLRKALSRDSNVGDSPSFEALIRADSVAGAPVAISIVATRIIHP